MKHRRTRKSVALGLLLLGLTQCNWISSISQGDLVKDPRCVIEQCNPTGCIVEVLAGKILDDTDQKKGDCVTHVCNDTGQIEVIPNLEDLPDDGNPCTSDECQGSFPLHRLLDWGRCYTGPAGTEDVGKCRAGAIDCGTFGANSECIGEVLPTEEVCDLLHVDDDCDGQVDEEDGPGCHCGDGFVQADAGEECDDENDTDDDACKNNCTMAECGDGSVQRAAGENCDDGNVLNGDDCPADCRIGIVALATGNAHACTVFANNVVKCWGFGFSGQLGLGNRLAKGILPQQMGQYLPAVDLGMPGNSVIALSAGAFHSCALFEGGTIKCWGSNSAGQLGLGDVEDRGDDPGEMGQALPNVDLGTGAIVTAISAGALHTCALLSDGRVKCWGDFHATGNGDLVNHGATSDTMGDNLPTVDLGANALAIRAGGAHTCALLENGRVKCWGRNFNGQLGLGDTTDRGTHSSQMGVNLPVVKLGIGKRALAVQTGSSHTCALLEGGSVKCWGANFEGTLGIPVSQNNSVIGDAPNEMGDALPAVSLGANAIAVDLATGHTNTCAILAGSSVKCWGPNHYGSLGLGDAFPRGPKQEQMGDNLPAVHIGTGAEVRSIHLGSDQTCVWLVGERIKCWGYGGMLGLGDDVTRGDDAGEMGDALPFVEPL